MGFFGKDSWNDENNGGGGTVNLPLSPTDIATTNDRDFISKVEKNQIQLNKRAILSKVDSSQVGVANGVAKLNAQGMVVNSDGSLPSGGSSSVEWEYF